MKQTTDGPRRPRLPHRQYLLYGLAGLFAWLGTFGGFGWTVSTVSPAVPIAATESPLPSVSATTVEPSPTPMSETVERIVPASRGEAPSATSTPGPAPRVDPTAYYALVSQTVAETLNDYTAIELVVPRDDPRTKVFSLGSMQVTKVAVNAPYWINIDSYAAARQQEIAKSAELLKDVFKWLPAASRQAKGTPSQIRAAVQVALAIGDVRGPKGSWPPSKADIERWMQQYGIGVDCSGFVYETLTRIEARLSEAGQPGLVWPLKAPATYTGTEALYKDSRPVAAPADLRPGDIMYLAPNPIGHVRIVLDARRDGLGVVVTTAESTDGGANGAVTVQWRYPDASRFSDLSVQRAKGWAPADRREQGALFGRRLPTFNP